MNVDYTGEESDKEKTYEKGIIGIIIALIVLTVLYNCGVAVNIDAVRDSLYWDVLEDAGIDPNDFIT